MDRLQKLGSLRIVGSDVPGELPQAVRQDLLKGGGRAGL
jgi:hypothetical protein